jgi:hypothetical protein
MIEYVAPVRGVELTRRKELLQDEILHPKAEDEYYKISLGSLVKLSKPIPADTWKRITFFYTTGEQILNANSISDLVIDQDKKELFQNTVMEYRSKYADLHMPADEMVTLQHEFLEYFLELNTTVKNDFLIQDGDFD